MWGTAGAVAVVAVAVVAAVAAVAAVAVAVAAAVEAATLTAQLEQRPDIRRGRHDADRWRGQRSPDFLTYPPQPGQAGPGRASRAKGKC